MWVRKMSFSIHESFKAKSPFMFMKEHYVVSRNPNLSTPRNTKPNSDIGWPLPENAVRTYAGEVKRAAPGSER